MQDCALGISYLVDLHDNEEIVIRQINLMSWSYSRRNRLNYPSSYELFVVPD